VRGNSKLSPSPNPLPSREGGISVIPAKAGIHLCFLFLFSFFSSTTFAIQPAVVSAHPEASQVGLEILKKGGSAADAAVAMAFALSVVEPHHSGLGGGGFLLYYVAKEDRFYFIDYREAAPQILQPKVSKKAIKPNADFEKGVASVGVPGFILGMETIHKKWRKVSWPAVIDPSIELAKKGFLTDSEMKRLLGDASASLPPKLDFTDLARTLENIKTGGSWVFYQGELGTQLVSFLKEQGGLITSSDLKNYKVYFRKPYTFDHGAYQVVSAGAPSSGGTGMDILFKRAVIYELKKQAPNTTRFFELLIKSFHDYFDFRDIALGDTPNNIISHTTHLCAVDSEGNIASMTNTLNSPFGSGLILPHTGIILNNELADFSAQTNSANRLRGGFRPLSSMAPTLVFKDKKPFLALGTPGGLTIPQNLFQVLYLFLDEHIPLNRSVAYPKIYFSPKTREVVLEKGFPKKMLSWFKENYEIREENTIGNVEALVFRGDKTTVVTDPRGQGRGLILN